MSETQQKTVQRAGLYVIGAALSFTVMGGVIKELGHMGLDTMSTVWLRNVCGLALLLPWMVRAGLAGMRTSHPGTHAVRDLTGLSAMFAFFYAIAHIPLAEAVLLTYTSPLFVPIIARIWLGETIPRHTWLAIGVGFIGLIFILRPGLGIFRPAAWIGWSSGFFAAFALTAIRRLSNAGEPDVRTVFYFALTGTVLAGIGVAAAPPTWPDGLWPWLIALGVTATAGQMLLTRGYGMAPPAQVGPFIFTSPLFAALLGILWGERPDTLSLIGGSLVITGNIIAARRWTWPKFLGAR